MELIKKVLAKEYKIKLYKILVACLVLSIVGAGTLYYSLPWTHKIPADVKTVLANKAYIAAKFVDGTIFDKYESIEDKFGFARSAAMTLAKGQVEIKEMFLEGKIRDDKTRILEKIREGD